MDLNKRDEGLIKNVPGTKNKKGSSFVLEVVSFLSGGVIMVMELTGSRIIAPYLGTSLVVWTALIGIIMASLCLGNLLGGYMADRRPERRLLALVVIISAFCVGILGFAANPVLQFISSSGQNFYMDSILAAMVLFTVPSTLLGMVSPFVARLAMRDVGTSGATVGRLSALNSAGSIAGTFLGGFVLISLLPSGVILFILAAVLAFAAFLLYVSEWKTSKKSAILSIFSVILFSGCAVWGYIYGLPMMLVGTHIETMYNHICIVESQSGGRRVRVMMTDPNGAQSLIYTDSPDELVSDYTKFYDLAFHFKPDTKRILMLGGGGYCVPRHILNERQDVHMDVVELDPGMTEAAKEYLYLKENPRLRVFHDDARRFLNQTERDWKRDGVSEKYDSIFMDVFGSWYSIPFHVATVEAMQKASKLLAPDGIIIANVISCISGPRSGVFHGIHAAMSEVFPRVLIFPASAPQPKYAMSRQNLMLVAFNSSELPPVPAAPDERVSRLLAHQWLQPFEAEVPAFRDSFAPIERYTLVR